MMSKVDWRWNLPLGLVQENKGLDRMLEDMAKIPLPDVCMRCGDHFCTCFKATPLPDHDEHGVEGFDCSITEMPKPR